MRNEALLYRSESKRSIAIAFAVAIAIHLCAVALASRHVSLSTNIAPATPDFLTIGAEEPDNVPIPPEPETSLEPPPLSAPAAFVEPVLPSKAIARNSNPIQPIAKSPSGRTNSGRAFALSAPRPEYPYEARRRNMTGSGIVALTVSEATGAVVGAEMEQSTGSPILDQSTLSAFRRWRFRSGTPIRVRVPITFTIAGASY